MRARDHGIVLGRLLPGPLNAITDVAGVRVGHTTLIRGDGPRVVGQGPVRTGGTVVVPAFAQRTRPAAVADPFVLAGAHAVSGCARAVSGAHHRRDRLEPPIKHEGQR